MLVTVPDIEPEGSRGVQHPLKVAKHLYKVPSVVVEVRFLPNHTDHPILPGARGDPRVPSEGEVGGRGYDDVDRVVRKSPQTLHDIHIEYLNAHLPPDTNPPQGHFTVRRY